MLTGGNGSLRLMCALAIAFASSLWAHAADSSSPNDNHPSLTAAAVMPMYAPPVQPPLERERPKRVVDSKFIAMGAVMMGLTIADLERTQHCLSQHTCQELNPMLPTSRAGMYAVNIPLNAGAMYLAYRLKAAGHRTWWIAPVLTSASHGVGVAFRF